MMTERERLIEIIVTAENEVFRAFPYTNSTKRIEMVADYLLENGVIVPPVKVGDTVYIDNVPHDVIYITINEDGISYCAKFGCGEIRCSKDCPFAKEILFGEVTMCEKNEYHEFTASDIGENVFLTREEAEKALKESEQK